MAAKKSKVVASFTEIIRNTKNELERVQKEKAPLDEKVSTLETKKVDIEKKHSEMQELNRVIESKLVDSTTTNKEGQPL